MASQNVPNFPPLPPNLKALNTFMKIASDLEKTDPVIGYWCRFYSVQNGLKIDSKSKESVVFLTGVMGWLEKEKKLKHDNEAITNEMVGQAHVENFAYNMFNRADTDDREGRASKNTPRIFLIASNLFEVLSVFGEVSEEITQRIKYAKWKAIYISRCLKNGETPVPGPVAGTDAEDFGFFNQPNIPSAGHYNIDMDTNAGEQSTFHSSEPQPHNPSVPSSATQNIADNTYTSGGIQSAITAMNGMSLNSEDLVKAQKYCKFAGSALQYEDIPTAINNLQKALSLLTSGKE